MPTHTSKPQPLNPQIIATPPRWDELTPKTRQDLLDLLARLLSEHLRRRARGAAVAEEVADE